MQAPTIPLLSEVLEQLAFLWVEPTERWPCIDREELLVVEVDFGKGPDGTLRLLSTRGFDELLTSTLLGAPPELSEPDGPHEAVTPFRPGTALTELSNVVGGHFVTEHYGPDEEVPLGIPRLVTLDDQELGEEFREYAEGPDRAAVLAEGHPMVVSLHEFVATDGT